MGGRFQACIAVSDETNPHQMLCAETAVSPVGTVAVKLWK